MPYRLLNIGQLLFLLPNPELKQKVRILEKLNKRFINAKIGTIFNRTYIYIHIYIYRPTEFCQCKHVLLHVIY